jgi:polyhydroxyalkanoate synthesis repressor PhaR
MVHIKRYSNRKLYNIDQSCYVTLEEIAAMVQEGEGIQVMDHENGTDITAAILAQVIHEQQKSLGLLLPQTLLARLLQFSDNSIEELRHSLDGFVNPKANFQKEVEKRLEQLTGLGRITQVEADHMRDLLLDPQLDLPPEIAEDEEYAALMRQVENLEKEIRSLTENKETE